MSVSSISANTSSLYQLLKLGKGTAAPPKVAQDADGDNDGSSGGEASEAGKGALLDTTA